MSVIAFPQRTNETRRGWRHDELQRLVSLHALHARAGAVADWDVEATEADDPQFYLTGADQECVFGISRVGRVYVLQDVNGAVLAENVELEPVVEAASRALTGHQAPTFVARLLLSLCAVRAVLEQKLEPILAESTETVTRFAPQLAAFI